MRFGFLMVLLSIVLVPYAVLATNTKHKAIEQYPTSEKVEFTSKDEKNIESKISKNDIVEDVDIYTSGRVIYVSVEYTDDVTASQAKRNAESILDYFDDDVIDYYEVYFTLEVDDMLIEGVDNGPYDIEWDW